MSDDELRLADYLDMGIVWKAVERDVPELGQQVRRLLGQAGNCSGRPE